MGNGQIPYFPCSRGELTSAHCVVIMLSGVVAQLALGALLAPRARPVMLSKWLPDASSAAAPPDVAAAAEELRLELVAAGARSAART